jgi:hypothetical protein
MAEVEKFVEQIRSVVGAKINQLGLLIWPNSGAPEETDTRLYIELTTPNGVSIDVVIGTDSDGQTPSIDFKHIDGGEPLSTLALRKNEWCRDDFWKSQKLFSPELFFIPPDSDNPLSTVLGQSVTRGFLVCFADSEETATGIVIELEYGQRVWSVPSAYGNAVKCEVADDWWPAPITLRNVMQAR